MEIVRKVRALQRCADADRDADRRIALVPTMGAVHAGHLALVAEARCRAEVVCVSIFVNPTQFGADEDLDAYPRPLEADLAACRGAGVDRVFLPDPAALYPPGAQTFVEVSELARPLCGRSRPVHFRGVATVVTKLLVAARPQWVVFGQKDFQQLALIRRLVRDLGFAVEVVGVPTVREPDGLALSSRNAYLDPVSRGEALALVRALDAAEGAAAAGERRAAALLALARAELAKSPHADVDYVELRDPETLELAAERLAGPALLALAVRFPARAGSAAPNVRLIDNRILLEERP